MSLDALLRPRCVAIVGATDKQAAFGNFAAANALQNADNVSVYFVNPNRETVMGKPCWKSIGDLPEVPDCALIATPKKTVYPLIEDAAKRGTKGFIVVASGYGEDGTEEGRADEEKLMELARKYDLSIMGPNCTGFVNNVDKIKVWGMGGTDFDMTKRNTGIAWFSQSGTMAIRGISCPYLDISYAFSMGNAAMVTIEDVMERVIEEDEVRVVCIYLEGPQDPVKFVKNLRRCVELKKPVVIHAAGMSRKGKAAAASHTGNLASGRAVYEALFRKYGVIMVENTDEFLCAADMISTMLKRLPKGTGFAAYNQSGGENTVCADMCEKYGINLPDFEEETVEKLRGLLSDFATPRNPLDTTASDPNRDDERTKRFLRVMAADKNIDAILYYSVTGLSELNEMGKRMAELFGDTLNDRDGWPAYDYLDEEGSVPLVIVPSIEDRRDLEWRLRLKEKGMPIAANSSIGYKVLGKICRYIEYRNAKDATLADAVPAKAPAGSRALNEYDAKELLRESGIAMPGHALVRSEEELKEAIGTFTYPLCMKICSAQILHKSDVGGVELNIASEEEAVRAYRNILKRVGEALPDAAVDGVYVTEMAPKGVEMIIGITSDPRFGPMLMVGAGGIAVEIFQDTALYPCPLSKKEALAMIDSLKVSRLLKGFRGSSPCDIDALADLMVKIGDFAASHKDTLREADLNPVTVLEEGRGAVILDALITMGENGNPGGEA